jgi:hypothetical protein
MRTETPFPKDDDRDYNPEIEQLIEDRLFATEYPDLEKMNWPELPERDYKEFDNG